MKSSIVLSFGAGRTHQRQEPVRQPKEGDSIGRASSKYESTVIVTGFENVMVSPANDRFRCHAAQTKRQKVVHESLIINQNVPWNVEDDPSTGNRFLRQTPAVSIRVSIAELLESEVFFT